MAHTERIVFEEKLADALKVVCPGQKWRHTKSGGEYTIVSVGINEATEEIVVVYKELSHEPPITWIRTFDTGDGWIEPTEIGGKPAARFTRME